MKSQNIKYDLQTKGIDIQILRSFNFPCTLLKYLQSPSCTTAQSDFVGWHHFIKCTQIVLF